MPNLFIIDILGTAVSEAEQQLLQHPNVGGILLFTRNFLNPNQLGALIASIRAIRSDIFIAVDHEGGIVQRFQRHGFRSLPAARVYGDVYDINPDTGLKLAEHYGEVMACDLLKYGIDVSLAPVLDVHGVSDVIAKLDRAFHPNPDIIAALAEAFIQGMHKAGMPAIGKHFPGHGSVAADSHVSMPALETTYEELENHDLKPFITLMKKNALDAVMPAHVTYRAIDPDHPAGFSTIWLQTILRDSLKFNGLVISDCLGMAGADIGNMQTRAQQALQAGCDILIVANQSRELLDELLNTTSFQQNEASLARIEAFKHQMKGFAPGIRKNDTPHPSWALNPVPKEEEERAPSPHGALNNTTSV